MGAVVDLPQHSKDGTRPPVCPRCGTAMKDVLTIQPVAHEPGLIAYECPSCVYITSLLTYASPSDRGA
jgi:hypothetical protein